MSEEESYSKKCHPFLIFCKIFSTLNFPKFPTLFIFEIKFLIQNYSFIEYIYMFLLYQNNIFYVHMGIGDWAQSQIPNYIF